VHRDSAYNSICCISSVTQAYDMLNLWNRSTMNMFRGYPRLFLVKQSHLLQFNTPVVTRHLKPVFPDLTPGDLMTTRIVTEPQTKNKSPPPHTHTQSTGQIFYGAQNKKEKVCFISCFSFVLTSFIILSPPLSVSL